MMRLRCISLIPLFIISTRLFSQNTFEKTYGTELDEFPGAAILDGHQNIIVVGHTSTTRSDPFILKISPNGDIIWQKTIETSKIDRLTHVIEIEEDNFVAVGTSTTYTYGQEDLLVVNFDSGGDITKSFHWGTNSAEIIRDLIIAEDKILIVGSTLGNVSGLTGIILVSLNFDLSLAWAKEFDARSTDWANGIDIRNDGSLVITGFTNSHTGGGSHNAIIMDLDQNGSLVSNSLITYNSDGGLKGMKEISNNTFFFGHSWSYGPGQINFHFVKTSSAGDISAERSIGRPGGVRLNSLTESFISSSEDAVYVPISEIEQNDGTSNDAVLLKVDFDGNIIWEKTYGGDLYDGFLTMLETDHGHYIIGNSKSFSTDGNADIYVVRTDLDGHTSCNTTYTNNFQSNHGSSNTSSWNFNQDDMAILISEKTLIASNQNMSVKSLRVPDKISLPDSTICEGNEVTFDLSEYGIEVVWEDGSTNPIRSVAEDGLYHFTTESCYISDTSQISYHEKVDIDLGKDLITCNGLTQELNASHPAAVSYSWSTGSTKPIVEVSGGGTFYVDVVGRCSVARDSIFINNLDLSPPILPVDSVLCEGESLAVNIPFANELIIWSDGSNDSLRFVESTGLYEVVIGNELCSRKESTYIDFKPCPGFIPNAFSPNNDGYNETFVIENIFTRDWELRIFNRNGREIFYSPKYDNSWKGENYGEGLYYYHLSNDNLGDYRGWIQVIR